MISFTVPGDPIGKGRPRFTKSGRCYSPARTVAYERKIAQACRIALSGTPPLGKAVAVKIHAFYPIPQSDSMRKKERKRSGEIPACVKPDLDNVVKAVLDACNKIAYTDDNQIVVIYSQKRYDDTPRVEVQIMEVAENE